MITEIERLQQAPRTAMSNDLLKAAKVLCKGEYERFYENKKKAEQDYILYQHDNGEIRIASTKHSDAPERIFLSYSDDCDCEDRISHQGQCRHLMLLWGGFCVECFEPRHFRRKKVTGSLNGWEPTPITDVLGIGEEDFDDSSAASLYLSTEDDDTEMALEVQKEDALVDQTSSRIKPLNHSALRGVLSDVTSFYNNCTDQVKFIIGSMSIKMKELVVRGVEQSSVLCIDIQNSATDKVLSLTRDIVMQYQSVFNARNDAFNNGLTQSQPVVAKPSASNIRPESKQRLKRKRESSSQALANKKQLLKVASLPGLVLGVVANEKQKLKKSCGFCGEKAHHTTLKCPRRQSLQTKGQEYDVSKVSHSKMFTSRVELSMPIVGTFDVTTSHIDTLDNTQLSQHIRLHSVYSTQHYNVGRKCNVNELYYRVTLIASNGLPDPRCTNKVFDGHLMNKWIAKVGSGIKVKSKFIYDETINASTSTTINQGIDHQCVGNNFALSQPTANLSVGDVYGLVATQGFSQPMTHSNLYSQSMQLGGASMPFSQGSVAGHSTNINNTDDWFETGGV